jgi:LacI family transcriptional regulator
MESKKNVGTVRSEQTTLDAIAREAGVSKITVFRVLNGKGKGLRKPAMERAEKIRAIAERLNYRPNLAARSVRTGRFNAITLLISRSPERSFLPKELLYGIHDELAERDQHLNIARLGDETLTSAAVLPKLLRELSSDGLLVNYHTGAPLDMVKLLHRFRIPSVWINAKRAYDALYPDDHDAGRSAAVHLLEKGHRRIAFVSFHISEHYSVADRRGGAEEELTKAGLSLELITLPAGGALPPPDDLPLQTALQTLRRPVAERPTAFITYSEIEATPLFTAANILGLKIGKDISLISFYPEQQLRICGVPLTTLATPEFELGTEAVKMLQRKIAQPERRIKSRPLRFTFFSGAS